jgi:hypothetical protein
MNYTLINCTAQPASEESIFLKLDETHADRFGDRSAETQLKLDDARIVLRRVTYVIINDDNSPC